MTKNIPTQSSTMMSRDMSANPLSGCQSDYLHMQVFVLLIFVDSCYVGSCGCSIADAVREAKRETVQPLKSMHWQKEEGCCHRNHCIQAHEEKPEWKSFFLFSVLTPSPSISPSRPPISPSLSSLSSHTTAYSPHTHKRKQKFPFTSCHTAWLLWQMGACSSHAHTQRGPLNIQVLTVAFIDI